MRIQILSAVSPVSVNVVLIKANHRKLVSNGLQSQYNYNTKAVTRLHLVDFVSVECSDLPALNVFHQLLLGVPVPSELLQELPVPLGQHEGRDGQTGRLHLNLLKVNVESSWSTTPARAFLPL